MSNSLINRAISAYFKHTRFPEIPQQPADHASAVLTVDDKSYVRLANMHGTISVYRVKPNGALKRLRHWPAALEMGAAA